MQLTAQERFAMERLFSANDPVSVAVRDQLDAVTVLERKATGVGFFCTVRLQHPLPDDTRDSTEWDWNFVHRKLTHGGSFVCWLKDHATLELEAISHYGDWPPDFKETDFEQE